MSRVVAILKSGRRVDLPDYGDPVDVPIGDASIERRLRTLDGYLRSDAVEEVIACADVDEPDDTSSDVSG